VFFGKASGFATVDLLGFTSSDSAGYKVQGVWTGPGVLGDYLGSSVASAGDVNNDTISDIIIGMLCGYMYHNNRQNFTAYTH
jgi:hypothetical protein